MTTTDYRDSRVHSRLLRLQRELQKVVLGYHHQTDVLLMAICAGGHISALGEPGTGKTFTMKVLARLCGADVEGDGTQATGGAIYKRLDMVPDLMPADIEGSEIRDKDGSVRFRYAVLDENVTFFHADELNRTPPRTQSALLGPMEEKRVSAPGHTFRLHKLFTVLATRNPIDSEGVYPLPIAQRDRFCVELDYGKLTPELQLQVLRARVAKQHELTELPNDVMTIEDLLCVRQEVGQFAQVSENLLEYANRLTIAVRPDQTKSLEKVTVTGVSPRAAIWLVRLAQARAYLQGRSCVNADDVQYVLPDVLRHRVMIEPMASFQNGWTPEKVTAEVLKSVKIPS